MAFSLKVDKVRVLLIEQFDRVSVDATMGWLEGAQLSNTTLTVDPATKHAILQESQRLEALSKPEIDQEYNELVQRQREAEIAGHWYNQTGLKANYQLWLRMPYWSLEEGLVLLSRRDPNSVSLAALEKEHKYVPFAVWLRDSLEMAKRSANVGLLKPNNAPSVFVSWAKDNKFEIAPELEEKMAEFGLSVLSRDQVIKEQARQLDEYESLIEEVKKPAVAMQETIDILNGVVATKSATIERMKEELADHQASAAAKPTDPRRTRSLHTTLIAVLIVSYGYVPGSKKNKVIADIQNALAERGLEVSADTLRKIIVDSEKHLPAEKAE